MKMSRCILEIHTLHRAFWLAHFKHTIWPFKHFFIEASEGIRVQKTHLKLSSDCKFTDDAIFRIFYGEIVEILSIFYSVFSQLIFLSSRYQKYFKMFF